MSEVIHRYIGKNGKIPKPTSEQREREASEAQLAAAKAREREAIAEIREMELRRRRGELVEAADVMRGAQNVMIVIRSKLLVLPTQLARKCAGKTQHEIRMIIDEGIREALAELADLKHVSKRPAAMRRAKA